MKLTPVANKIIIKVDDDVEVKTTSGLYIPSVVEDSTTKLATVAAVGPGIYSLNGILLPLEVQVGDRIIIKKTAGVVIRSENIEYKTITQDDIIAIIEE